MNPKERIRVNKGLQLEPIYSAKQETLLIRFHLDMTDHTPHMTSI